MSKSEPGVHIMSPPILEAEEIPYDRADMGPGVLILEVEFNREEIDRLRARHPRGPLIRFVKQAALEASRPRGCAAKVLPTLHAVD